MEFLIWIILNCKSAKRLSLLILLVAVTVVFLRVLLGAIVSRMRRTTAYFTPDIGIGLH